MDRARWQRLGPVVIAFLCAWLTIAITGHQSGAGNNLFHLPILTGLYDQQNFRGDAFVQSIRFYASGFWMLMRHVADRDTMLGFFLPLQVASRFLFFVGVLAMARPLCVVDLRQKCVFLVLVALAFALRGTAPAGDGGLLVPIFTHSELANGTTLIALALAMRDRFGAAVLAWSVTFFINMFMAVWLAPALAVLAILSLMRGAVSVRGLAPRVLVGGIASLPLIVPVLMNVFGNPEFGRAPTFDYPTFLRDYWPMHFLVDQVAKRDLVALAGLVVTTWVASLMLEGHARTALRAVLISYAAIWLVGAIVPLITRSPTILNLHLLRSSAIIVIITVVAVAATIARLLDGDAQVDRRVWAPLLALLLVAGPYLILLVPVVLLLRRARLLPLAAAQRWIAGVALLVMAVSVGWAIRTSLVSDARFRAGQREWLAMATWARQRSAPGDRFLLPTKNINFGGSLPHDDREPPFVPGGDVFEAAAQRRVWVGFKEGAAAMWTPSYYGEWHRRVSDVLSLHSLPERVAYARRNGIAFVVDHCPTGAAALRPTYDGHDLCVYRANEPERVPSRS
ncbi:MAG: hypothetical protein PGN16_09245 [Sphingomonas phyllosphaerae]|uniref:hypothetical protein n=1 Tax=Sphingomonas phyllosphaerae TaxID=257003 RepID=UPI002FF4AC94